MAEAVARVADSAIDVADLLAQIAEAERLLDELRTTLVAHMVDQGASWPEVAAELGVSRQAVRKRYGRLPVA